MSRDDGLLRLLVESTLSLMVMLALTGVMTALLGLEHEAGDGLFSAEGTLINFSVRKERPLETGSVLGRGLLAVAFPDSREGPIVDKLVRPAGIDSRCSRSSVDVDAVVEERCLEGFVIEGEKACFVNGLRLGIFGILIGRHEDCLMMHSK